MKKTLLFLFTALSLCLSSCKDKQASESGTTYPSHSNTNEHDAGQNIGATADSTSADGPPGNPSNH